jgi:hypothetical protein
MVQAAQMMEGDADLQNALVQIAYVASFGAPEELERFVLLEELASIELRDAFEQRRRWWFFAAHAVS